MSYSSNPVADAAAHYDSLDAVQEAQKQAEIGAIQDFMKACRNLDANALAGFAPMTTDWEAARAAPHVVGTPMPKRMQTLAEVMADALDLGNGPTITEVMQLVLVLAFSADAQANQALRARQLLESMAQSWAHNNVTVE